MKNKIILAILILSVIALVFTGCDGNPVLPTTNFCGLTVEEEIKDIFLKLNISEDPRFCPFYEDTCTCFYHVYDDLKEAIDKEIDPQEIPGLTYRTFILNALYEEELVNNCYPAFVVGEASDYFSKLADNLSNWENNFASQTTKWAILGAIQALGMPTFGIGTSSLFLAIDLLEINVAMAKLAEVVRNRALFYYLFNRSQGDSHETAWGEGIPLLWSPEKKQATENFFKSLWSKYGEAILSDNLARFKEEQHEILRELILQALSQPPIASLTPEEIELIRKWGYGGDYVVRWPNGYVDVYDATNYSQMQEVLNQWNAVIGGPAILRLSNNPNSQVKVYYKLIFGYCGNRDVKWNEDYTFSTIDIQISDNTASCGYPSTKYALYLFMFKNVAGFKGWTTKGEDVPYEEWTNFTEINDTMKKMVKALYKVPPGYYLGDTKQRKDRSNSVMKNIFTSGGGNCLDE